MTIWRSWLINDICIYKINILRIKMTGCTTVTGFLKIYASCENDRSSIHSTAPSQLSIIKNILNYVVRGTLSVMWTKLIKQHSVLLPSQKLVLLFCNLEMCY